ncbi:MAG TPA: HAD family hydrolase [Acidimicrobiia bacterium]|nr:HAD family hydrolase [Acidimicrobiia bacterium]
MPQGPRAVLLDFYGTLACDVHPLTIDEVLGARGYSVPGHVREQWWQGDLDGIEHVAESQSREHYAAFQQERMLSLLADADVHPGEYEVILAELHAGRSDRKLRAYDEVPDVLRELRARGLTLAICSNWDWDLEPAVAEAGLDDLVDVLVSSAWAGARKPHPRIFRYVLERVARSPRDVLFVGDTWGPDVEGPRALGMDAAYLERDEHWPDTTRPSAPALDVPLLRDLAGILELV